jgi:hypothetical protein
VYLAFGIASADDYVLIDATPSWAVLLDRLVTEFKMAMTTIHLRVASRLTIGVIRVLPRKGDVGCNFLLHFWVFPFSSIELGEKKM